MGDAQWVLPSCTIFTVSGKIPMLKLLGWPAGQPNTDQNIRLTFFINLCESKNYYKKEVVSYQGGLSLIRHSTVMTNVRLGHSRSTILFYPLSLIVNSPGDSQTVGTVFIFFSSFIKCKTISIILLSTTVLRTVWRAECSSFTSWVTCWTLSSGSVFCRSSRRWGCLSISLAGTFTGSMSLCRSSR